MKIALILTFFAKSFAGSCANHPALGFFQNIANSFANNNATVGALSGEWTISFPAREPTLNSYLYDEYFAICPDIPGNMTCCTDATMNVFHNIA